MVNEADIEFVTKMLQHHEMALTMASREHLKGKDPQIKNLAMRIYTAQKSEIAEMKKWLQDNNIKTDTSKSAHSSM